MPGVARYVPRFLPLDPDARRRRMAELLERARCEPGSVPYPVADLEAVAAWLAIEPPMPDAGVRASAERLLTSPQTTFVTGSPIPNVDLRESPDLVAHAYRHWLLARAKEAGEPWEEAARWVHLEYGTSRQDDPHTRALAWLLRRPTVPFPVGKACPVLRDGFPAAAARELMPLEGDEYAAVVIPFGSRGGALLCMCRKVRERYLSGREWIEASDGWGPDGRRVEIVPVPKRSIPPVVQQGVRRWWRAVNGLPIRAGRPAGPAFWNAERIVESLLAYARETGGAPRSREAFVEWAYAHEMFELTPGSAKVIGDRWNRELRTPFPEVRDAIADASTDVWAVEAESV